MVLCVERKSPKAVINARDPDLHADSFAHAKSAVPSVIIIGSTTPSVFLHCLPSSPQPLPSTTLGHTCDIVALYFFYPFFGHIIYISGGLYALTIMPILKV